MLRAQFNFGPSGKMMDFPALEDSEPQDPALHRATSATRRAQGDELGALAHLIAAEALEANAAECGSNAAMRICNVATGYFMKGEHDVAARWYRLALVLAPQLAIAWQNLAVIHAYAGQDRAAADCRERAYRIQRVFIESADDATDELPRVLILCVARAAGNVPLEILFPTDSCCRIKYAIDYAAIDEDENLPPYDLVFNAIGDPDVAAPLSERLQRFVARCQRPLLNRPEAVTRSGRQRMAELFGAIDDVCLPPCLRIASPPKNDEDAVAGAVLGAGVGTWLSSAGIAFPVLVRPAASHGGVGLTRCENLAALTEHLASCHGSHYLSAFCDSRGADGYYRKYRIIYIDREPYPYHLAISSHWMVHYFSAEMTDNPERIAEERRFLEDPSTVLGARAMAAISAIGQRLDLDYAGIDFTLLPDGRVLLFEANATMLVHRERSNGLLAHKTPHVQRIVDAFLRLQGELVEKNIMTGPRVTR